QAHLSPDSVPHDGCLTEIQKDSLKNAIKSRKTAIKRWYRWQTNVAHLARSGGSNGVLKLDVTLAGGDELKGMRAPQEIEVYSQLHYKSRIKSDADAAIEAEGITSRGNKLLMRKVVTREKYSQETEDIKAEVRVKHQAALEKWRQTRELNKAGIVEQVDEETKLKALSELGGHLDRIFRHLSHKTGGFKFSCIAGGRNPITGEVVILDFHLGETDLDGTDFHVHYPKFSDVQAAYAAFVTEALSHDDHMETLREAQLGDNEGDCGSEIGMEDEELAHSIEGDDTYIVLKANENLNSLLKLATPGMVATPAMEDDSYHLDPHGEITVSNTFDLSVAPMMGLVSASTSGVQGDCLDPNTLTQQTIDLAEIDRILAAMPQIDLDLSTFPSIPLDSDIDSFFMGPNSDALGLDYSLGFNDPFLIGSNFECLLPPSSPSSCLPGHPALQKISTIVTPDIIPLPVTSAVPSHLAEALPPQLLDQPRRTMRPHVPSTREHVLNAIGSSSSRARTSVADSEKENGPVRPLLRKKRKAGSVTSGGKK
ncbi:hypothetical protein K503DRAFT_816141, partial [Rhizopogon vinicolor AM-OR11-026]